MTKHRARDLDLLLDGEVELVHLGTQIDIVEAKIGKMLTHHRLGFASLDGPKRTGRAIRQEHVVEDGKVLDQRHFLEGGLDAALMRAPRRGKPRLFAEDPNDAGIGQDEAAQ